MRNYKDFTNKDFIELILNKETVQFKGTPEEFGLVNIVESINQEENFPINSLVTSSEYYREVFIDSIFADEKSRKFIKVQLMLEKSGASLFAKKIGENELVITVNFN